jgi:hypothetical protein
MLKRISGLFVCLVLLSFAAGALAADLTITITVSPKVMILSAPTQWVHIHSNMPLASVERSSLVASVNGNPFSSFAVFADSRGNMVIKIGQDEVEQYVTAGTATFTVTGVTKTGLTFAGSDTIQVKD